MEYRHCQPLCAQFIASDDPHSKCVKCLGFSHAREAVYGISKCTFCENSPVEFAHDYLYPSPGASDAVSFGLDDILLTAASKSEDFGPALADALPPSGQEAWPSAAYSELVDVLSRATEKLSLDWPDEPHESQASKLDERFLSGPNSRPEMRKLTFFSDLHQEEAGFFLPPYQRGSR